MSAYSVLEITPNSDDWVANYVASASELVASTVVNTLHGHPIA